MADIREFTSNFISGDNNLDIRKDGIAALSSLAFPTRKTEAWKYTRVNKIVNAELTQSSKLDEASTIGQIQNLDCYEIYMINGRISGDISKLISQNGVTLESIAQSKVTNALPSNDNVFTLINQAYFTDGIALKVAKNVQLDKPIHVIHLGKGESITNQIRHRVELEQGGQAQVIYSYLSDDNSMQFNNVVFEGLVAENASLTIVKIQDENENTSHIAKDRVDQKADSRFSINTVTVGGKLVRNDLEIDVNGKNCETVLNGAFVSDNDQHIDNHSIVDHKISDCYSNELYKGVMAGKSTGVFNGKVFVRQDAQRINAFQSNGNILLSDNASIYTKPELEIYADDVKCSHGTTTGQLDDEAVFYLRARGLSEKSAKRLLVGAFVKETIENIELDSLREHLEDILDRKFNSLND